MDVTNPKRATLPATPEPKRTPTGVLEAERIAAILRLPDPSLPKTIDPAIRNALLDAVDAWTAAQRRSDPWNRAKGIALLVARPAEFDETPPDFLIYLKSLCGTNATDILGIARPTALVLDMWEFLELDGTVPHLPTLIMLLDDDTDVSHVTYDFPFKPEIVKQWEAALAHARRGLKPQ